MCKCIVVSTIFALLGIAVLVLGFVLGFAVFDILIDDHIIVVSAYIHTYVYDIMCTSVELTIINECEQPCMKLLLFKGHILSKSYLQLVTLNLLCI